MDALVVVKFLIRDVCSEADFGPGELHESLDSLVRDLIQEEGILGVAEDEHEVVSIREAK